MKQQLLEKPKTGTWLGHPTPKHPASLPQASVALTKAAASAVQDIDLSGSDRIQNQRDLGLQRDIWLWLKRPVPKWVALRSGNMDQNRATPPV